MPLSPGAHLGPYEVLALIGAGGMGEVYRARDSRLGREVAIKVLPHDRVADESRRQRFVQEAKAASALNHPHIITIYEIESANGIDFLVMEYVRGKSLDALIPRQGMRLGEALRIAIAVADAIACAHKTNIVHRDLKPANVMVGVDGAVKVLDFGLAKLLTDDEADPHALTRTADEGITKRGAVMGTLAYMSPEQASGEPVDARSDIFSFGTMLYEMVTGVGPFAGRTPTDTMANVLRAQPKSPNEVVPTLPRELERLILRCLRREPARRFQHMADVKVDLQEVKEESDSGTPPPPTVARRRGRAAIAIGVLAMLVVGAGVWLFRRSPAAAEPPMRVVPLTTLSGYELFPTFSPDGEQVAFTWDGEKHDNSDIYVTIAGSSDVRRLTTDPAFDGLPSWSPDGRQIAFVHRGPNGARIHVMSSLGGSNRELSDFPVSAEPIAWSPDSHYIAAGRVFRPAQASSKETGGIWLVPTQGGDSHAVTLTSVNVNPELLESDAIQHSPAFSPDGRRLAYASCTPGCDVYVVDLDASLVAEAPPRRLTKEAVFRINGLVWSRHGRSVIYDTEAVPFVNYLWRVGADGDHPPERIEVAGVGAQWPATVPSQDRLAFTRNLIDIDIYRFQVGRSPEPVVASSGLPDAGAQYSPDGRQIAFASVRSGDAVEIWRAAADGSGVQQLTYRHRPFGGSPRWSPDGRRIAFDSLDPDGHWHIWTVAADGGAPQRVTTDTADENVPTWSRDGRWVYFAAKSAETQDIWKVSSQGGVKQRVTQGGSGIFACESADGKNLLYQATTGNQPLLALPLAGGPARQLVACVKSTAFAEGPQGIYYLGCDADPSPRVHLRNRVTGKDELLGTLEQLEQDWPVLGLGVSPDGTSILYTKRIRDGGDLMLIENFK